jgi:PAS domain S-box-containing protein
VAFRNCAPAPRKGKEIPLNSTPTTGPAAPQPDSAYKRQLREMNEALLVSSVRQHELAEKAQKAEVRYRRLFETAKDGILILDIHTGRISEANPFMGQLLGYSPCEFSGKELWEIGLFSGKSANEAAMRELQENGEIRFDYIPLETKRGQRVDVEVVANIYNEDQQSAIQFNIREITQRRKTELALARALIYADDIIATLREPFLVLDPNLRVKTGNRSFYDLFQVTKEETEKRPC